MSDTKPRASLFDTLIRAGALVTICVGMVNLYSAATASKPSIVAIESRSPFKLPLYVESAMRDKRQALPLTRDDTTDHVRIEESRLTNYLFELSYSAVMIVNQGTATAKDLVIDWPSEGEAEIYGPGAERRSAIFERSIRLGDLRPNSRIKIAIWARDMSRSELPIITYDGGSVKITQSYLVYGKFGAFAQFHQNTGWTGVIFAIMLVFVIYVLSLPLVIPILHRLGVFEISADSRAGSQKDVARANVPENGKRNQDEPHDSQPN